MVYSHCHAHSTHCYISIAEIYHCDDVSVYVMHIVYTLFTHCLHPQIPCFAGISSCVHPCMITLQSVFCNGVVTK